MTEESIVMAETPQEEKKFVVISAEDLDNLIKAAGKEEAAAQIERAVENFDKGNLYLSVALSLVK